MRDALQAGMHADSKFKSRQKMNAAKTIQGLNNISAERLVSPIWARFSLLENKKSFNKKVHAYLKSIPTAPAMSVNNKFS